MTNHNRLVDITFEKTAQHCGMAPQKALELLINAGIKEPMPLTFVAMGAVIGSMQVLAAMISPKNGTQKPDLTPDSILVALLMVHCCSHPQSVPEVSDAFGVGIEYHPGNINDAFNMFERLTGRKAATVIDPNFAQCISDAMAEGEKEADDLLNKVCANRKPI